MYTTSQEEISSYVFPMKRRYRMWKLYDELIGKIPPDILVDRITIGLGWTVVSAGSYCGTAMTVKEHEAECGIGIPDARQGFTLKSLASLSKSLEFYRSVRRRCGDQCLL
jgi:hypothetical protein